jgi:hypothetical protein
MHRPRGNRRRSMCDRIFDWWRRFVGGPPRKAAPTTARQEATLEPVGAVGDPPAQDADGKSGGDGPPERQKEVGDEAEYGESEPEHFPLHRMIVEGE